MIHLHSQFLAQLCLLGKSETDSVRRTVTILRDSGTTLGMRPHRVGGYLSLSANMDLRIIARIQGDHIVLLWVDHHDEAYRWARNHPPLDLEGIGCEFVDASTLAAMVNIHGEAVPMPVDELLTIRDEGTFLAAISTLSPEWQEWLLDRYTGGATPVPSGSSLVFCPEGDEELDRALHGTWPDWQLFLHPRQRDAATDVASRSIMVRGGPGTGKSVVLLNRLILAAPKGRDPDVSVLLVYDQGLAGDLLGMTRAQSGRHFYVFPFYLLAGQVPQRSWDRALRRFSLVVEDGALILHDDHSRRRVRELLVDESQDLPQAAKEPLAELLAGGSTRLVLGLDPNQAIHRRDWVKEFAAKFERHYDLTYSYRSTRQILEVARGWREEWGLDTLSLSAVALSGPRVRFVECDDRVQMEREATACIDDYKRRHDADAVSVIFGQYYNPTFRGENDYNVIRSRNNWGVCFQYANKAKGREYACGVVLVPPDFMQRRLESEEEVALRVNTLYVALSRFRNEVTVIYQRGGHVSATLRRVAAKLSI